MYKFSASSQANLLTCHADLIAVGQEVIKYIDCTAIQGYRSCEEQNELYRRGLTKLEGGQSKHNYQPSLALDLAPYTAGKGIVWSNYRQFYFFGGAVKAIAAQMGISLRWGGDWDGDNDFSDQTFIDLLHFELTDPS